MADTPRPSELCKALNISRSYASMILSGQRVPPRPLAIEIFRRFGIKLGSLENLTTAEADQLAKLEAKAAA